METCPVCHGTGKITSSAIIDEEIERKISEIVSSKGVREMNLRVSPMLGAYLSRGLFNSYIRKWRKKYGIRLRLDESTEFSVLQNELYDNKGKRLDQ